MGTAPRHLGRPGRITTPTGPASSSPSRGCMRKSSVRSPSTSRWRFSASPRPSERRAHQALEAHAVRLDRVRLHHVPTDRVWLRDSAPIAVHDDAGAVRLLDWGFNALGQVRQLAARRSGRTARLPRITGLPRVVPTLPDGRRLVLEGGGIDVNGDGLLLVTEEWLLSDVQVRNPGLTRPDYEAIFREWLGIRHTIWLGEGCVGDDTHGHVDDVARFVSSGHDRARGRRGSGGREPRPFDGQRPPARAAHRPQPGIGPLRVVRLPFPRPVDDAAANGCRPVMRTSTSPTASSSFRPSTTRTTAWR